MNLPKRCSLPNAGAAVSITENQRQILLQLFAGSAVEEIATGTGRRPSTIGNTIRLVRKQMGARSDVDLLRECLRREIVTLDEISALADELRGAHGTTPDDRHDSGLPC
jgi:DNA-binding CsgD family transcriptional regulator